MPKAAPWVHRWNHHRPSWMGVAHYEAVARMAREVEARTPYLVSICHKNCRVFVGPEFSPWGVWSTKLFNDDGNARYFVRWRDGINADDIVRIAMLSQQDGSTKAKNAEKALQADQRPPSDREAREAAREQARHAMADRMRRRVYA